VGTDWRGTLTWPVAHWRGLLHMGVPGVARLALVDSVRPGAYQTCNACRQHDGHVGYNVHCENLPPPSPCGPDALCGSAIPPAHLRPCPCPCSTDLEQALFSLSLLPPSRPRAVELSLCLALSEALQQRQAQAQDEGSVGGGGGAAATADVAGARDTSAAAAALATGAGAGAQRPLQLALSGVDEWQVGGQAVPMTTVWARHSRVPSSARRSCTPPNGARPGPCLAAKVH
jgi:hypothetical protein